MEMIEKDDDDDFCHHCENHCPTSGQWHCPVCDAEWNCDEEEDAAVSPGKSGMGEG